MFVNAYLENAPLIIENNNAPYQGLKNGTKAIELKNVAITIFKLLKLKS